MATQFADLFPEPSKKQFADAIVLINQKYRRHYKIQGHIQLTHEQVEDIIEGVREYLYKYEDLKPLPPEEDDDEDYGDITTI